MTAVRKTVTRETEGTLRSLPWCPLNCFMAQNPIAFSLLSFFLEWWNPQYNSKPSLQPWKHFLICLSRLLFIAKNIVGAHSVIGMGLVGTGMKRNVGPQGNCCLVFPSTVTSNHSVNMRASVLGSTNVNADCKPHKES